MNPMNETSFVTCTESMSHLQSFQSEAEEGTGPTASSGAAEQNKGNSSDGDDEQKVYNVNECVSSTTNADEII